MAEEVARLVAIVEANLKGFTKGMEDMNRIADRRFGALEKRMKQSESRFASFGRGLRNTLLGGISLVGIQRFVSAVGDMAGKLQDTSDALGVGTDALQTWGVLAGRAGVGQDQFNKSLGAFAARLGEAQLKGGPFAKFLQGIGVGTQGTTEEVFNRLADAVKNTANQQQRAAIVAEAFGARAVRLTPILQQGSAALKAQGVEFAKNGQIMSSQAIAKIDELGDKWEDLKRRLLSTGANALTPLIDEISSPGFQEGLAAFATAMSQVAVAIARMSTHLPALAGVLIGLRTAGAPGAAVGGTFGLLVEAWRRQTGLIQDSIAKLEKDLANAQDRAARREPGAADQVTAIQAQINRQKAQSAGIPFAGTTKAPADGVGIDRSGTLSTEKDAEADKAAKEKAEIEKQIAQNAFDIQQEFRERNAEEVQKAAEIEAEIRQHYADVQQGLWETEAEELADFHARAAQAWDDYYQGIAESAETSSEIRLRAADQFFGSLASLTRSSSEELQAIGKAAAIIQATIDGVLAVQKALASFPPPINFAVAAAVGAAAAVNVATIAGLEHGGRVQAGIPYIVGEKRPELFVPDQAGTIIPRIPTAMAKNGIGSNAYTFHIDARGATPGVERMIEDGVRRAIATSDRNNRRSFARNMIETERNQL